MSVELIAILAAGVALAGVILTATRGLMTACHRRREMSTIVVTIVLSLMGLSSCGEAEETTSRSTATSEEELAAQLGTDTEPVDAGHNRNIDVGTLSARAGAPTDGKTLARWEPSPEMAKTLRLPFFEKATLTYRAGKMILVSQYGDGGRLERVLVERPAEKAAERKFDMARLLALCSLSAPTPATTVPSLISWTDKTHAMNPSAVSSESLARANKDNLDTVQMCPYSLT